MFAPYHIVFEEGEGQYEEKRSRFIAGVWPVQSEEEAAERIDHIRKKYYDARHHCTAYIIGRNREITRCSDDGEPSGTAGKPILEVLLGAGVTNVVAVVTRYFGGTLLGTGGLVRAYTQATKEALANAVIARMCYGVKLTICTDYTDVGKVQYFLGSEQIAVAQSRYTDKVELDIQIPKEKQEAVTKKLQEVTSARVRILEKEEGYYCEG